MHQPAVRCIEFVEMVTDWTEGALSADDRAALEEHLCICPACSNYVTQLRLARAILHEPATDAPPAGARDALLEAFRQHAG